MKKMCINCGTGDTCTIMKSVLASTVIPNGCILWHPDGSLLIRQYDEIDLEHLCVRCGEKADVFCNAPEYVAYECLCCRLAYRKMSDGEVQVISGYDGPGMEDFILVKNCLVVSEEVEVQ